MAKNPKMHERRTIVMLLVCAVLLLLSLVRSDAAAAAGGEVPFVVAGVTAAAAAAVGSSSNRLRGHQRAAATDSDKGRSRRRSLLAATTTVGRIKSQQQQQSTGLFDRKRFYKEQDDTTTTNTTKKKNTGKGPQQHPSNNKNNATRRPANNESNAAATATTTRNQETQQSSSSLSDESELRSSGAVVVQKEEIITVSPGTRYKLNLHSDLYQNSNNDPNTASIASSSATAAAASSSSSIATNAWEDTSTQIYIGHEIVENSNSSLVKIEMVRKHDTEEYGTVAGSSTSTSSIHVHIANGSFDNTVNNNNTVTIRMLEEDDGENTDGNATHQNHQKNPLRGPNNSNGGATIVQVGDQQYDTYIYEYATPVDKKYIKLSKGGYGERFGRVLRQVRFNKIPPIIDNFKVRTSAWRYVPEAEHWLRAVHTGVFPLLDTDYPLLKDNPKVQLLRSETMADSVTLPGDYQLHGHDQAGYWLQFAGTGGGASSSSRIQYPGAPGGTFWDEFRHVVQLQIARRNNSRPSDYNRWPDTWDTNATLDDCAQAVKGEYPGHHQAIAAHQLFTEGLEMHRDMSPFRSVIDFVGTEVRISCINSWAIDAVSAINFMLKWYVGMPRPEEIAWMVSCGAFTTDDGVPDDIIASVQSMKLNNAEEFTAYSDGSPMHPSYPAMHAAASSLSYWLPAVAKVTPEQYCECLRVDYATAYARTVAGVHYPMDNIAGLNIGQRIVQEQLPAMMAEKYGYDAAKVRTRLDALAFDWNQFDPHECTINGISIAIFLHQAYRAGLS